MTKHTQTPDNITMEEFKEHAVNCHDELVEALENVLDQLATNYDQAISKHHKWPNERVNMTSAASIQARKALAKAKGDA